MSLSKLSVPELLAEEAKAEALRKTHSRESNTWRQADARIDHILEELNRRAEQMETLH